jgi:hypothetical protein
MTTEAITSAIEKWADAEPITLEVAPSGRIHLSIHEPDPRVPSARASVVFDISPTGQGSSFSMSREGDDEYTTHGIPSFWTEGRLILHLQRYRNEFFRDFVYGQRLEEWLEGRDLHYRVPEYDFYITGPAWTFFEYRIYEISDLASGIKHHVGVHGDGSVVTFASVEEDILVADDMADLPDPAAMLGWIEKALNFGRTNCSAPREA